MTACTNHGGKARRVVTAALVGALSVGTVPMVALATGADTTDGIETMAAEWYTGAKVTKVTDGKGKTLTGDLSKVTLEAGKGKYLAPTEISNGFETTKVSTNDYVFIYYTSETDAEAKNSNWVAASNSNNAAKTPANYFTNTTSADTYYLVIAKKDPDTGTSTSEFTAPIAFMTAKSEAAQGVKVDGTLTYNGSAYDATNIKFVDADGREVEVAAAAGITFYSADGTGTSSASITDAGDYYAKFTGTDTHSYTVPVTIEKLDLSKATLTVSDANASLINSTNDLLSHLSINDVEGLAATINSEDSGTFSVTKIVDPDKTGSLSSSVAGEYTVTVSAKGTKNVAASTGTVTYSVLDSSVFNDSSTEFKYGRQDLNKTGALSTVDVSLLEGESFDASKVTVEYDGEKIAADGLEVSYEVNKGTATSPNWKACDAADLAEQGSYRVTVRVKPFSVFGGSAILGGTAQFNVKVTGTEVDQDSSLGFYVDGELAGEEAHVTFDGSDWLEKVTAVVKDEDGNTLTEGTDYELEVTLDGEEVTEAVDASSDAYEVKVVPLTFNLTGQSSYTFKLYIDAVDVDRLVADVDAMELEVQKNGLIPTDGSYDSDPDATATDINKFYVKYTGSAVEVPAVKYEVSNAAGTSFSYVTLDPSLYNVVSIEKGGKVVEEAVEEGTYTVTIALSDEAKSNYSLLEDTFEFTVKEYGHFVDVNPEAWYAQAVEDAWYQLYVNGVGGTDVFMPETKITRADAVGIIYNMAGGAADDDFSFDETHGYVTGFDDVDGHAYYARAIAWAENSHIVNGHGGLFRPTDDITREEFAAMLANYAKATGKFVASDGSALAALSDASSVSAWAQESVAWAVENEVMGNGGFVAPQDDIARAEVAAMAVNYQPENLEGLNRDNPTK